VGSGEAEGLSAALPVVVGGADFYRPACEAHHSREPINGAAWAEFS
jgi:thymidine kinase